MNWQYYATGFFDWAQARNLRPPANGLRVLLRSTSHNGSRMAMIPAAPGGGWSAVVDGYPICPGGGIGICPPGPDISRAVVIAAEPDGTFTLRLLAGCHQRNDWYAMAMYALMMGWPVHPVTVVSTQAAVVAADVCGVAAAMFQMEATNG